MCSIIGSGERLHKVLGQIGSKLWFPWQQKAPIDLQLGKWCLHLFLVVFDLILLKKTTFYFGTLDSGERSLPFGLLVIQFLTHGWIRVRIKIDLTALVFELLVNKSRFVYQLLVDISLTLQDRDIVYLTTVLQTVIYFTARADLFLNCQLCIQQ